MGGKCKYPHTAVPIKIGNQPPADQKGKPCKRKQRRADSHDVPTITSTFYSGGKKNQGNQDTGQACAEIQPEKAQQALHMGGKREALPHFSEEDDLKKIGVIKALPPDAAPCVTTGSALPLPQAE
jgi:hypothetical protein